MEVETDVLEILGIGVGVALVAVGVAVLVGLPTTIAAGIGVALGQVLGGMGSVALGAGLVLLVRRG